MPQQPVQSTGSPPLYGTQHYNTKEKFMEQLTNQLMVKDNQIARLLAMITTV